MTILSKIYEQHAMHGENYQEEPEFLFVNLNVYEELLKAPQSVEGVPKVIAGAHLIPANKMQRDIAFFSQEDMNKALNKQLDRSREDVFIFKLMIKQSSEINNQYVRRIAPDRTPINVCVPFEVIEAYKRYLDINK